jgi:hypothetical protein
VYGWFNWQDALLNSGERVRDPLPNPHINGQPLVRVFAGLKGYNSTTVVILLWFEILWHEPVHCRWGACLAGAAHSGIHPRLTCCAQSYVPPGLVLIDEWFIWTNMQPIKFRCCIQFTRQLHNRGSHEDVCLEGQSEKSSICRPNCQTLTTGNPRPTSPG